MAKLDARLRHLVRSANAGVPFNAESIGLVQTVNEADTVEVLVRGYGEAFVDLLRALDMRIHFVTPGPETVVSGTVTVDGLARLAQIDSITRIESSRRLQTDLAVSRPETGAAKVQAEIPSVRGDGVIIGIIEGGVDYTHPALRNSDGTSRILFLWDQSGPRRQNEPVPYGREYAKAELDAALATGNPLAIVPRGDVTGHGTHVAGIAAANGRAGEQFTGMAPDADLIVVAYQTEAVGGSIGRSVHAYDAFAYIVGKANGAPVVINLSLASNGGGHSGETVLETALDNLLRQPNVAIVKSAGNEQLWRIHAGGEITVGQDISLSFRVESNDLEQDIVELWFDGADAISVSVQPPGGTLFPFVEPGGQQEYQTMAGNFISIDSELDSDGTGDTMTTFVFSNGSALFIQPGDWKIVLRGGAITIGRYDLWIERVSRDYGAREQIQFLRASADMTRTITIPGTARRVITVGSYVTTPVLGSSPLAGDLSRFSSHGPTRYGLEKPDLCAPGEMIISARSAQSNMPATPDARHTSSAGTSMAAPHVTGIVALMLSVRPGLTCEQIRQILVRTARRDGFSSQAPDDGWGNGKVDAVAAVGLARLVNFPAISNVQVVGASLSWETDLPTTGAVRFNTHQRRLHLGKESGSRVDLGLGTHHVVDLSGLAPGTYYCEILAFTSDNWATVDDKAGDLHQVIV